MPNIKGVKKRVKQSEKQAHENALYKSNLKKDVKALSKKVSAGASASKEELAKAHKALDKAAKKGIIHKKTAARKKSRLDKKINNA